MFFKKTFKDLLENLIKDRKRLGFFCLLLVFLSLGLGVLLSYFRPKKLPGLFPITGAYQAYFEIEVDKTTNIFEGEEVVADIYLTTSGEGFDVAVAKVEWNENDFSYKNLSAQGQLNGRFVDARVGGASGPDNNRILTHYVVTAEGDPAMQLASGARTKFASLILAANIDNPVSEIVLSEKPNDLALHFIDSGATSSVDQSLAFGDQVGAGTPVSTADGERGQSDQSGFMKILESTGLSQIGRQKSKPESLEEPAVQDQAGTESMTEIEVGEKTASSFTDRIVSFLRPVTKKEKEMEKEIMIERQKSSFLTRIMGFFKDLFERLFN